MPDAKKDGRNLYVRFDPAYLDDLAEMAEITDTPLSDLVLAHAKTTFDNPQYSPWDL